MKLLQGPEFDPYRVPIPDILKRLNPGAKPDACNGVFVIRHGLVELRVIAASGGGWDHVSVHASDDGKGRRIPTWDEMEFVKRKFFKRSEVVVQYHVTPDQHVNINPHVLHLWRKHKYTYPLPPLVYV